MGSDSRTTKTETSDVYTEDIEVESAIKRLLHLAYLKLILVGIIAVVVTGGSLVIDNLSEVVDKLGDTQDKNLVTVDRNAEATKQLEIQVSELDSFLRQIVDETDCTPEEVGRGECEVEPSLDNAAIIEALQTIARIEGFLCGGPCPEREE